MSKQPKHRTPGTNGNPLAAHGARKGPAAPLYQLGNYALW